MSARKMKDSGNQWIGEIPEEWETRKIKFIHKFSNFLIMRHKNLLRKIKKNL